MLFNNIIFLIFENINYVIGNILIRYGLFSFLICKFPKINTLMNGSFLKCIKFHVIFLNNYF